MRMRGHHLKVEVRLGTIEIFWQPRFYSYYLAVVFPGREGEMCWSWPNTGLQAHLRDFTSIDDALDMGFHVLKYFELQNAIFDAHGHASGQREGSPPPGPCPGERALPPR